MLVQCMLVLSLVHWAQSHLIFPVNFCYMATACIHDNRMICASSPDGCSRRNFLDQCDMYEYNCDYGTRYQETYILYCKGDLEGEETTPINEKSVRASESSKTEDDYLEAELTTETLVLTSTRNPCFHTIPRKPCPIFTTRCPCVTPLREQFETTTSTTERLPATTITFKTTTPISKKTSTQTSTTPKPTTPVRITSKITTALITPKITTPKIVTTLITTATTKAPKTTKTIYTTTQTLETTTMFTEYAYCCDRPVRWLTTTEKVMPVTFRSFVSNELPKTKKPVTTTKWTIKSLPTAKIITVSPKTTTSSIITTTNSAKTTTRAKTKIVQAHTSTVCCDRPATWLTTTEKFLPFELIENNVIEETKESIIEETDQPTVPEMPESPIIYPSYIYKPREFEQTSDPVITWIIHLSAAKTTEAISTKKTTTPSGTIFTKCCDRPLVWSTTTEKYLPEVYEPNEPVDYKDDEIKEETIITTLTDKVINVPEIYPTVDYLYPPKTLPQETYPTETYPPVTSPSITHPLKTFVETIKLTTKKTTTEATTTQKPKKETEAPLNTDVIFLSTTELYSVTPPQTTEDDQNINKIQEIQILKLPEIPSSISTWWYPTACPSNKCQRPMVWETTKSRRRRKYRN